eukprot:3960094-Karenia_brevis.AAC.1
MSMLVTAFARWFWRKLTPPSRSGFLLIHFATARSHVERRREVHMALGSTGVSGAISGASRPANTNTAASTPLNQHADFPQVQVPTPKSKISEVDR